MSIVMGLFAMLMFGAFFEAQFIGHLTILFLLSGIAFLIMFIWYNKLWEKESK